MTSPNWFMCPSTGSSITLYFFASYIDLLLISASDKMQFSICKLFLLLSYSFLISVQALPIARESETLSLANVEDSPKGALDHAL